MAETQVTFHGAAGTVTGSCTALRIGGHRLLVDCGLFQGARGLQALNAAPFAFDPARLDAVIVTHAHLDHSGLLPRLVAAGYRGPIWCTPATAELVPLLLADSARLNEQEAARRNRRRDCAGDPPFEPLYTVEDAARAVEQLRPHPDGTDFDLAPGVTARFWNAGHILGSASVELRAGGLHLLFSGDLGPRNASLLADPVAPAGLDHVFMESTYGDRARADVSIQARRELLATVVDEALARGGNLLIPAFALERTQELLLDLATLINRGRLRPFGIFIDSPLATRITQVFARHAGSLEDLGSGEIFRHPAFHYVEDVAQSRAIETMSGAIILAGSGMCEGGRIRHHLLDNLPRTDSTLLFVGFQAAGTLGRTILEGARRVRISGEDVNVRLQVRQIDSYSAHADKDELIAWARGRKPIAGSLFLMHGEASATAALGEALAQDADLRRPVIGEVYALEPGSPARRLRTGRPDMEEIAGRGWQNDYADLAVNLRHELAAIADDRQRREAIAKMRAVLDAYRTARRR
jgi:metallo-beta-lactamase family protein